MWIWVSRNILLFIKQQSLFLQFEGWIRIFLVILISVSNSLTPMLSHGRYASDNDRPHSVGIQWSVIVETYLPRIILLLTFSKKLYFRLFCWARNKWSFWICGRLIKGESLFMKRFQEAKSFRNEKKCNVREVVSLGWIRVLTWIELRKWVRFTGWVKYITQRE